jgi:WD repeat and SOF domain-containing protein 1
LNATKLDKTFARPFLGAMSGHRDTPQCLTSLPHRLGYMASGSMDGEVRLWSLASQKAAWTARAHTGFVRGITADDAGHVYSCGQDKTVRMWKIRSGALGMDGDAEESDSDGDDDADADGDEEAAATSNGFRNGVRGGVGTRLELQNGGIAGGNVVKPVATFLGSNAFSCIDHHRTDATFATGGARVDLWDVTRQEPVHSFEWGADSVNTLKFNLVQTNVMASTGSDRNIILYDVRTRSPIKKVIMTMQTNALCWNPMEAFNFTTANEDCKVRFRKRFFPVHSFHLAFLSLWTLSFDCSIRLPVRHSRSCCRRGPADS